MNYRPEIDGLRAVAVLPVILFHAGWSVFSGGYVGVDVFFVISGYLITSIISDEISNGRFSLIMFYERRARRILPALFFMVAGTAIGAWFWLLPLDMIDFGQSLMAVATFSSNILFWMEDGYFATASEYKPLLHTWSLAVEEQYYVLFPIGLMLVWRFGRTPVFILLALIFITSLLMAHWGAINRPGASFYLLPTRIWELMSGALCALYLGQSAPPRNILTNMMGMAGLGMIGAATIIFDDHTLNPSLYTLLPIMGTVFIILFASHDTAAGRLLGSKPLVWVGLLSYSAYLWHQPLFVFARFRLTDDQLPLAFGILGLATFLIAWISYRFVEQPFRNRKTGFSRATIFTLSGVATAATIGFGYYLYASDGAPGRFDGTRLQTAINTIQFSPRRDECHASPTNPIPPAEACRYNKDNSGWAVMGDSHAVELAYGLAEQLKPHDDGVMHLSFTNCAPSFDTGGQTDCARWSDAAVKALTTDQTIQNIVVIYRMAHHLYGGHEWTYPVLPDKHSDSDRAQVWAQLLHMLETLSATGKHVYFVVQTPEVSMIAPRLLSHISNDGHAVSVSASWWEARNRYVMERLDQLPSSVTIINPADKLCDTANCYAVKDFTSLYFDDDHLSVEGAKLVADMILKAANE